LRRAFFFSFLQQQQQHNTSCIAGMAEGALTFEAIFVVERS
jgi:hypothetical protein